MKTYRYSSRPELLPVREESSWPGDKIVKAAGFNPEDEEIQIFRLSEDWRGHKKGALVVSELQLEDHSFTVV